MRVAPQDVRELVFVPRGARAEEVGQFGVRAGHQERRVQSGRGLARLPVLQPEHFRAAQAERRESQSRSTGIHKLESSTSLMSCMLTVLGFLCRTGMASWAPGAPSATSTAACPTPAALQPRPSKRLGSGIPTPLTPKGRKVCTFFTIFISCFYEGTKG